MVGLAFELNGFRGAGFRGDLRMASSALGLAIFLGRPTGRLGAFLIALASSAALAFLEGFLVRLGGIREKNPRGKVRKTVVRQGLGLRHSVSALGQIGSETVKGKS